MPLASFEGKRPEIGEETYIHPSADVFGDVVIGRGCWVGPGARLRGDYGSIRVGDYTSIEDNCVIHARPGETCTIADWVTIGHGAVIHNAKRIDDAYREEWTRFKQIYVDLARRYPSGWVLIAHGSSGR